MNGDGNSIVGVAMKSDTEFATVGVRHFKEWTYQSGALKSRRGKFGKGQYSDMVVNIKAYKTFYISGTLKGEILIWNGTSVSKCIKGKHEGPVDAIEIYEDLIFTGGRQGNIVILDSKFNITQSLNISTFDTICPGINAFAYDGKRLIVGTRGSEVFYCEFDLKTAKIKVNKVVTAGHYSPCRQDNNEVWGLSIFQNKDLYISVSDDATMRVWNTVDKKMDAIVKLNFDMAGKEMPLDPATKELSSATKGRSVDISPNGKMAAVGFRDGSFRIYTTKDWKIIQEKKHRKEWISDVKFSPNGDYLAVGSHDNFIDVYAINDNMQKFTFKGHNSFITHLDWSESGGALHSTSGDYELLYWDMNSKVQDKSGASNFRDEEWSSWTTVLGWPVQGIWEPTMDGSDINAVDRSPVPHSDGYKILATGDDKGKVKLFRYPCCIEQR